MTTDPLGRVNTYTPPVASSTQTVRRPSGLTLTIGYNSSGQVSSFSNGVGTWAYAYSVSGTNQTTTVTDPLGHTRTVTSDLSMDKITSDADAYGHTTTYAYDGYSRLTRVTYPEGNYNQYTYDARGNVTQTTRVAKPGSGLANIVTSASFDATCVYAVKCNKPNSTTDALGNVTAYTYSTVHGGVLSVTRPATPSGVQPVTGYGYAQVTTYAKNASGTLVANGLIWELASVSNCATSAASITATSTSTTTTCGAGAADETVKTISYASSYNAQPTGVTTAAGDGSLSATTSGAYDIFGNATALTNALGSTVTNVYDADRELVGSIAPQLASGGTVKSRASYTTYNADGFPLKVQQGTVPGPSGITASNFAANFTLLRETVNAYDAIDRLATKSVDGGGAPVSLVQYTYDNANRVTCGAVRMNAAAFSSLPSSACALGTGGSDGPDRITLNTYDNDNRVIQVTQAYGVSGSQINERTLTYSANGNLLTAADGNGNLTTSTFDGFDRLSQTNFPTPSNGSVSSSTDYEQYTYDAASRPTQDRRRDGQVVTATYDNLGRVTALSNPSSTYVQDNYGRLTSATRGGQTLAYTYDALGRQSSEAGAYGTFGYQHDVLGELTGITWPDSFYVNYIYDAVGEVTQIQENGATSGAGLLAQYAYNDLGGRASLMRGDNVTTTYGYDGIGRLSSLAHSFPSPNTANNQTETLSYGAAGQIDTRALSNPAYDWRQGGTATAYTINGQNQVTVAGALSFGYDGRGNLSSDGANSYGYDVANNLTTFNSTSTLASDPVGRLMSVTDYSGGNVTTASRAFRYGGSSMLAEYGTVGSDAGVLHNRYVPGPGVDETVVAYTGATTTQRYWLLTDERGSVTVPADVNGAPLVINTYDAYGMPASGNLGRFQYTGQAWIPEIGLYHYKARDYAPSLGRFLQTDPIGYGDGLNWYIYAHGDPVNGIDSAGTSACTGCNSQVTVLPSGAYYYYADGGVYYFSYGGNASDPDRSNASSGDGVFTQSDGFGGPDYDMSDFFGSGQGYGGLGGLGGFIPVPQIAPSQPAPAPQNTITNKQKLCAASKTFNTWADQDAAFALRSGIVAVAAAPVPFVGEVVTPVAGGSAAVADLSAGVEGLIGAGLSAAATGRFGNLGARAAVFALGFVLPGSQGMGGPMTQSGANLAGMAGQHINGHVADALAPDGCP